MISGDKLGARYGRLLSEVERTERKMLRAIHTWERARAALKACGKRLDKLEELRGQLPVMEEHRTQ